MTREDAWVAFASSALVQAMNGIDVSVPGILEKRSELAARWADAMTVEWANRYEVKEDPPRRRKAV